MRREGQDLAASVDWRQNLAPRRSADVTCFTVVVSKAKPGWLDGRLPGQGGEGGEFCSRGLVGESDFLKACPPRRQLPRVGRVSPLTQPRKRDCAIYVYPGKNTSQLFADNWALWESFWVCGFWAARRFVIGVMNWMLGCNSLFAWNLFRHVSCILSFTQYGPGLIRSLDSRLPLLACW